MKMFSVIVAIGLSACTTVSRNKSGSTQQDFASDTYSCERDMRQSGYFGGGVVGQINAQTFQERCMAAKGWTKVSTPM